MKARQVLLYTSKFQLRVGFFLWFFFYFFSLLSLEGEL